MVGSDVNAAATGGNAPMSPLSTSTAGSAQPAVAGMSQAGKAGAAAGVNPTGAAGVGPVAGSGGSSIGGVAAGSGNASAGSGGLSAAGMAATAGAAVGGAGVAGSTAAGSSASSAGSAGSSTTAPAKCGGGMHNGTPFGCGFAWGTNDPGGSLSAYAGLQFMSKWVGYEVDANGNLPHCDGCSWLTQQVQPTALIPVYYAYFIGYFGKAHGLPDGNENPNGPNLTTDAALLIRDQRPALLAMYSSYAKQSAAVWKDKPLVWLLEGDFVQYSGDSQKMPLSYQELGDLARDITCAIKSEMPNAVVAINHSTWNGDEITNSFWGAMSNVDYDLVWTTAVANNQGFLEMGADASKYNAKTATFAYLHKLTGRNLFVDTSFGLSQMADSWSGADAATLNARIAEGVIAANVTMPPGGYVAKVGAIGSQLQKVCQ